MKNKEKEEILLTEAKNNYQLYLETGESKYLRDSIRKWSKYSRLRLEQANEELEATALYLQ